MYDGDRVDILLDNEGSEVNRHMYTKAKATIAQSVTNDEGSGVVVQAWARDPSRLEQLWYPQIAPIVEKAERYVYIKDDELSPSLERRIKLQTQNLVTKLHQIHW